MPPDSHGPWRNPFDEDKLVDLRTVRPGEYQLTVLTGASASDLVVVAATLPPVVYLDHRPATPNDSAVVLRFRALPDGAAAPRTHPTTPTGAAWLPAVGALATTPPTRYEQALSTILTTDAYSRYGRTLVHGLAHCDPRAVIAAADATRTVRSPR